MSKEDELFEKVRQDLEKSGFGSEMRAVKIALDANWNCNANFSYYDKDEKITREADFYASFRVKHKYSESELYLAVEVKKTSGPWVVFKQDLPGWGKIDFGQNLMFYEHLPAEPPKLAKAATSHSLVESLGWSGYGIHESFKKPSDRSRWYGSFVTACKAAEHIRESFFWLGNEGPKVVEDITKQSTHFAMIKPVVVIDGPLLSAMLNEKGDIEVDKITAAPLEFSFRTEFYQREKSDLSYRVDIVALQWFGDYLKLSERRVESIHDRILKLAKIQPEEKSEKST